jgi:hypothetical protein
LFTSVSVCKFPAKIAILVFTAAKHNKPFNPTPNLSLRYAHGYRHFMRYTPLSVGRGLTER